MQAGDLTERAAFDAPTQVPDGYGGQKSGWSEAYACRAHFRYLRGGEAVQAARLEGRQPVVVTIRDSAAARGITPEFRMRDTLRGDVYNVRTVVPDGRHWIELTCEKGVAV